MQKNILLLSLLSLIIGCSEGSDFGNSAPNSSLTQPATPIPIDNTNPDIEVTDCTDSRSSFADKAVVEEVCRIVNQERNAMGFDSLKLDAVLSRVAQAHAEDMYNQNYFSHLNLEGLSSFDRMHEAGITYHTAGENIARGQKSPAAVMLAWMNSSGHRANILKYGYGKIGIGFYKNYWVQDFTN